MAKRRCVPITEEHYFDWALEEFEELKAKHGVRKATEMFNEEMGEDL